MTAYVGRFAPSPTGLLHAGSLVAALASWLDARAHGGRWLVRIEDLDGPRTVPGASEVILGQLERCGLVPDEAPVRQSDRTLLYQRALDRLIGAGLAYPCGCSRSDLLASVDPAPGAGAGRRSAELVYPGTCRTGLHGKVPRSFRFRTDQAGGTVDWTDRRLGIQHEDVERQVGDVVLKRADGVWAYQLAVVVDDADQGISDVVRGEDLAGNTARQVLLQRCLGLPTPRYLHTPLVLAGDGQKLSKQTGARPLARDEPLVELRTAAAVLGLRPEGSGQADWLASAVEAWAAHWLPT